MKRGALSWLLPVLALGLAGGWLAFENATAPRHATEPRNRAENLPDPNPRSRPQERTLEKEASAKTLAEEFFKRGGKLQHRRSEFFAKLGGLGEDEIKRFIAEIESDKSVGEAERDAGIRDAIESMAKEHPRTALELSLAKSKIYGREMQTTPLGTHHASESQTQFLTSVLKSWLHQEPEALFEWLKADGGPVPCPSSCVDEVIRDAAQWDLMLALKMENQLRFKMGVLDGETGIFTDYIVTQGDTIRERIPDVNAEMVFRDMRNFIATREKDDVVDTAEVLSSQLASSMRFWGRSDAMAWLEKGKPTAEELWPLAKGLAKTFVDDSRVDPFKETEEGNKPSYFSIDAAKWLDWFGSRLSADHAAALAGVVMKDWAPLDPKGAADWIEACPEGAAKAMATHVFHERLVATGWGEGRTLPDHVNEGNVVAYMRQHLEGADRNFSMRNLEDYRLEDLRKLYQLPDGLADGNLRTYIREHLPPIRISNEDEGANPGREE